MDVRLISTMSVLFFVVGCGGSSVPTSANTSPAVSPPASVTRTIALSGDLAFGDVDVGATATHPLIITNNGNAPLTVNGLTLAITGFSSGDGAGFSAYMRDTIPAGGSRTATVYFSPRAVRSYTGSLTVNADQTGGTNTIAVSGSGVFLDKPMFTLWSACPWPAKIGAYNGLVCYVAVSLNGDTPTGMTVTVDKTAFGGAKTGGLATCPACGQLEWDMDLTVPASMSPGTVPITFTVTDAGGRIATTTSNLQVVR